MKMHNISTKLISALLILVATITISAVVAITQAGAAIAISRSAVVFTLNPGQTARINIIAPALGDWNSSKSRRVLLGFDVYKITERAPRAAGSAVDTSCVKYHMIERQACEVMIGSGEAASFDFAVPPDGVATQISPVFSVEGNDSIGALRSGDLSFTIEMREGGRTTGIIVLPAVQGVREAGDR